MNILPDSRRAKIGPAWDIGHSVLQIEQAPHLTELLEVFDVNQAQPVVWKSLNNVKVEGCCLWIWLKKDTWWRQHFSPPPPTVPPSLGLRRASWKWWHELEGKTCYICKYIDVSTVCSRRWCLIVANSFYSCFLLCLKRTRPAQEQSVRSSSLSSFSIGKSYTTW